MSERKHSPAEIRAYWKGYGAGLTGLDMSPNAVDAEIL